MTKDGNQGPANIGALAEATEIIGAINQGVASLLTKAGLKKFPNLDKMGLDEVLNLGKKGVYFHKDAMPGSVYLEAAERKYSALVQSDKTVIFHVQTERIIEDPESNDQGMVYGQTKAFEGFHSKGC
ncbi:MAG: hypothetical protein Q8O89_02540 [Nanoarchaeota archaeon]|nr:hypothetical protein [Nanoarchaeota archaeon]